MTQKDIDTNLKVVIVNGKKVYRCGKIRFGQKTKKDTNHVGQKQNS